MELSRVKQKRFLSLSSSDLKQTVLMLKFILMLLRFVLMLLSLFDELNLSLFTAFFILKKNEEIRTKGLG